MSVLGYKDTRLGLRNGSTPESVDGARRSSKKLIWILEDGPEETAQ